jgi:retron-type reverse transcriptase
VDRESASQYAQNLENNVANLVNSIMGGWYRAKLVLRKYIPKLNGKLRPLGLPSIADKLLQTAVAKILEAIRAKISCLVASGTDREQVRIKR